MAAIEQNSRALFVSQIPAVTVTNHAPVHVRDDMTEWDVVLTHQCGCKTRGAIDGDVNIVAPVYTHFDANGRPVSRAFVISVLSGFVSRQSLVNGMIVNGEMPCEISSAIVAASKPLVHSERVI